MQEENLTPELNEYSVKRFSFTKKLVIGIIIFLVIFFIALTVFAYWLLNSQQGEEIVLKQVNIQLQDLKDNDSKYSISEVKETSEDEWLEYNHDILGIKFKYPKEWGNPQTSPSTQITDLETITSNFYGDNIYVNSIYISFPESETHVSIRLFNEYYEGETYTSIPYSVIDNVNKLKETKNVCDYKIDLDNKPNPLNTVKEIYQDCKNDTKTILTEEIENFVDFPGPKKNFIKYRYKLRTRAFGKLQNGYFDNILTSFNIHSGQIDDRLSNLDEFSKVSKDWDKYLDIKDDFVKFTNSIESFELVTLPEPVFVKIPGEKEDITTVRWYYFLISSNRLEEAYDMYKVKNVGLEEYKEWYQTTFFINPYSFERISENRYRFFVDLQDHNRKMEKYRVTMDVQDGKIDTVLSEQIVQDWVYYDNLSAFIKKVNDINYVVLDLAGVEEKIIDQSPEVPEEQKPWATLRFTSVEFSPSGKYLTYRTSGWEWGGFKVYDIQKQDFVIDNLDSPINWSFINNEEYLYACAHSMMNGTVYGYVYRLPEFDVIYDLFDDKSNEGYMNLSCEYNKDENVVGYKLWEKYNLETQKVDNVEKTIKYSLELEKEID